ncbi:MAG: hypothetical protein ACI4TP_06430 [Anaerotignum sp.]
MEDWKREEGQGKQKEKTYVTRREFYICFLVLLAVIFWRTGSVVDRIREQENNISNHINARIDYINSQILGISDSVAEGVEKANSPLGECVFEIADVDLKEKTVLLRFMAIPNQVQEGNTSLQFHLSCDGAEPVSIPGKLGADHHFTAEQKITLCDAVAVTATMQMGDTTYLSDLGEMGLRGTVYPFFSGYFGGSYTWTNGVEDAAVQGEIRVEVQPGDWMQNHQQNLILKNPTAEIYVDGKRVQRHSMQTEQDDFYMATYIYEIEETFQVSDGQTIEVFFKAEDENGLKYTYLVDRSRLCKGDVQTESAASAIAYPDDVNEGRLTVE